MFAEAIAACEEALAPHVNWVLTDVLRQAKGATPVPVRWAVSVALAELWQACGVRPAAVVGHSAAGKMAAAVVSGELSLEDGAKAIAKHRKAGGNLPGSVPFKSAVDTLASHGHRTFLEISAHPVLAASIKEILDAAGAGPEVSIIGSLQGGDDGAGGVDRFLGWLGQAFAAGLPVDWPALFADSGARQCELPTYAFRRERFWLAPPAAATAPAEDEADAEFWAAVEQQDKEALTEALGVDAAALDPVLPALASWRTRKRAASALDGLRYRTVWRAVGGRGTARLAGSWLVVAPAGEAFADDVTAAVHELDSAGAHSIRCAVDTSATDRTQLADQLREASGCAPGAPSPSAAQAQAPALLDEAARQGQLLGARNAAARTSLQTLAHAYSGAALAPVNAHLDLVDTLAGEAAASLATGRAALAREDRTAAVAAARAAQSALDQATGLLDAVDRLPAQLQDAASHLGAAVAGLREEMAQAERLAPADPVVTSATAAATAAIAAAQQTSSGGDPLGGLRVLTQRRAELAAVLAPLRQRAATAEKTLARLTELLGHTNAQIGAVSAYIDTHRDAVGPEARTRLADGVRHVEQAQALASGEPEDALTEANRAARLVHEAQVLAEHDVSPTTEHGPQDPGGASTRAGTAEVMLGGILIEQILRGRGRGFRGRGC